MPKRRLQWTKLSNREILDLRFCDLKLSLADPFIKKGINTLYKELDKLNIPFHPHMWLSNEWFSPDGIPGVAIPFYLAHPKLRKLEKKMMLEVEGGTSQDFMKILRHEAGHAISTAYRLHYKASWRKIFGKVSKTYPTSYKPRPVSKNYVLHLDWWYAQSHPAEDFAETFAVWLGRPKLWRQQYAGWPALKKLIYVDDIMKNLSGKKPVVTSRAFIEPISQLKKTLSQHYQQKRKKYVVDWPDFYDRDLKRLFSNDPKYLRQESAVFFLRRNRSNIRQAVSDWTGEYQYTIDRVLKEIIERCRELKLRRCYSEKETKINATLMVTVQTMNYLYKTRHWIAL